ncbi:MAG: hypothetical protein HDR18_10370 [Lachnospiraceae bacterium]|nr:hypothetical protein [Lachnospiraceae bacterium]
MHRSTFIALLIPLLMLTAAMAYRYYSNDIIGQTQQADSFHSSRVEIMIHENITKLKDLGIDATSVEEKITESLTSMPTEILESMEPEQIGGMILTYISALLYDDDAAVQPSEPRQFFTFDVECMDLEHMYTNFLNSVSEIAGEDLTITDINEDTGKVDYESGTGVQTVTFNCNGKSYQYDAIVYNDWFDVKMLSFMSKVISEQNTDKNLYVTSDGYQECIVFYQTKDWVKRFNKSLGLHLEQP